MNENTLNNLPNTSTPTMATNIEPFYETQNHESENISFKSLGKSSSTKWFGATSDSPYPPFCRKLNGDQSPLVENIVIDPNATQTSVNAKVISLTSLKTSEKGLSPEASLSGNSDTSGMVTKRKLLSTISGVFAPVALSMFSVLLFLRLGFVVGHAGLAFTFVIYLLTYFILLTTVLSVAAVATNGAVEGGGAYFMISRTLGPEFGGGIGAVFFAANVFSSALYTVGCAEALLESFGPGGTYTSDSSPSGSSPAHLPEGPGYALLYATAVNALNLIICLSGSSVFARASLAVLTVVVGCAASVPLSLILRPTPWCVPLPSNNVLAHPPPSPFLPPNASTPIPMIYVPPPCGNYTGFNWATLTLNLGAEYGRDYMTGSPVTFMTVFGVVFSGATGIMAGANMSGDLKNPQSSIPRGTLLAVAFTFAIYLVLSFLVAGSSSRYLLQNDYIFLAQINVWAPFVTVGILLATITAGLSNLMGASRVLEAVARDRIFGSVLNRLTWTTKSGNPIPAVLVSWLLVQAVITMGSLNRIAGVTTVFFLLSYLAINVSCCALELASAPNFRPSFKYFTWYTALSGSLACLFMMFVVTPTFSTLGLVICAALVLTLHWKTPAASWGSLSQALLFHQVRKYLLLLDPRKEHVKYWRPQILQLVADPRTCCELIDFANDLKKSGLFVVGHVSLRRPTLSVASDQKSPGNIMSENTDTIAAELPYWLALMDSLKVKAFVELTSSESIREGCSQLMRLSGLGAMKPNTIILGFLDDRAPKDSFLSKPQLFRNRRPRGIEVPGANPDPTPQSTPKNWPPLDPWWWSSRPSRTLARPLTPSPSTPNLIPDTIGGEDSVFIPSEDLSHIGPSLRLGPLEYIGILRDALAMNKNLVLARNFSDLDKRTLLFPPPPPSTPSSVGGRKRPTGGPRCYIDVWLQDFFQPAQPPTYDSPATLFLLQLACVLNMVRAWNGRSALRVFICLDPQLQDPALHEAHLKSLLAQLRIPAQVHVVEWNVRRHFFPHPPQSQDGAASLHDLTPSAFLDYLGYANRLVAKYSPPKGAGSTNLGGAASSHNFIPTAVLFAYLPSPPPADATEGEAGAFLAQLEILTRNLPPTCMVHGISTVTTTML